MEIDYGNSSVPNNAPDNESDSESDNDSIWDSSSITPPPSLILRRGDALGDEPTTPPNDLALGTHEADHKRHSHIQSEFPRLRRTHLTDGYREGLSSGKAEEHLAQSGFDSGFPIGAAVGLRVGFILRGLRELDRYHAQHRRNATGQEEFKIEAELSSPSEVGSYAKHSTTLRNQSANDVIKTSNMELGRAAELENAETELLDVSNSCVKELQDAGLLSAREELLEDDPDEDEVDVELDLQQTSKLDSGFGQTQDDGTQSLDPGYDFQNHEKLDPPDHEEFLPQRTISDQAFDEAPDGTLRPDHDAQQEQQHDLPHDWLYKLHTINKWENILQHRCRQANIDLRLPVRPEG
ncbi:MAG: Essential protein Yae1, N terminal [Alyxoria varia]|nr:MAG: Essential protein Yae1, N terminal [Alyxoria varia]